MAGREKIRKSEFFPCKKNFGGVGKLKKSFLAVSIGLLALVLSFGCGGGGGSSPLPPLPSAGNTSFYLTDAATDNYDAVWVVLTDVSVRNSSGSYLKVLTFTPPKEVNILELQNVRDFLGSVNLPAGSYDRVKLGIQEIRVVDKGQVVPRQVPVPPGGVEIPLSLTVSKNGAIEVVIDFQAGDALKQAGIGLQLDPTKIIIIVQPRPTAPVIPPPPPTIVPPEQRPVAVEGVVKSVDAGSQSFVLAVHHAEIRHSTGDVNLPELLITTDGNTRYFPSGKSFGDIQVGDEVKAVGTPNERGLLALEIFLKDSDVPPLEKEISGLVVEVLYDLKMVKVKTWDPDPCWQGGLPCPMGQGEGGVGYSGPGVPEWVPPADFVWVAVTDSTVIQTPEGTPLGLSDLRPQQFIRATGTRESDFFKASQIIVYQAIPGPHQVSGVILEILSQEKQLKVGVPGGGFWPQSDAPEIFPRIDFILVQVTDSTVIETSDGQPLTFEDLQVGMFIHASGNWGENNLFIADKIIVSTEIPPGESFEGVITEKFPDQMEFDASNPERTQRVKVTGDTKIADTFGNHLGYEDLVVGNRVVVRGHRDDSTPHTLIADFILVLREEPPPPPQSVHGFIVEIQAEGRLLRIIPPGWDDGGGIGPGGGGGSSGGGSGGGIPIMDGLWVHCGEACTIEDSEGNPMEFSGLEVGMFIIAHGQFQPRNNRLVFEAFHIQVTSPPPPPEEGLSGVIREKNPDVKTLLVGTPCPEGPHEPCTVLVKVTENTEILDEEGNPIGYDDLQVGDFVHIRGHWEEGENHLFVASFIQRFIPPPPPPAVVEGEIIQIDGEHSRVLVRPPWMMGRPQDFVVWVQVTEDTIIENPEGNRLTFGDLKVGMWIRAEGEWGDLTIYPPILIAHHILVLPPPPPPEIVIKGVITEKHPDVHGLIITTPDGMTVKVKVTEGTRIRDEAGNPLTYEDLKVGDHVVIGGHWEGDSNHPDVLIAHWIQRENAPPPPQLPPFVFGKIIEIRPDAHIVLIHPGCGGDPNISPVPPPPPIAVVVKPDTQIQDREGNPLTFGDLKVGMFILAFGEWGPQDAWPPHFIAHKIIVLAEHSEELICLGGFIAEIHYEEKIFALANPEGIRRVKGTEHTVILNADGTRIRFNDLQIHDFVMVVGERPDDPTALVEALLIIRQPPPPPGGGGR